MKQSMVELSRKLDMITLRQVSQDMEGVGKQVKEW
jgi:hypothetical protein